MRKGFRPSLEPPSSRLVNLDGRRPAFCVVMTTAVIVLIAAIFAVSALSLHRHRFGQNGVTFHAGDQVSLVAVTDDLTPVFCDGYTVTLMGHEEVFLLRHHAKTNQSLIATSSFALHHEPSRRYSFLEVYLLPGSTLDVKACRENGSLAQAIHILLIKGSSNFNKWARFPRCASCVFYKDTILPSEICGQDDQGIDKERGISMNVTLTNADRYMLVVHYAAQFDTSLSTGDNNVNIDRVDRKAGVIVSGTFNRTRYDTTNAEKSCRGRKTCEFDLDWGSSQDIVVDFMNPGGKVGKLGQERKIVTECKDRMAFWLLLFLCVPVLLGVPVAGVFSWFLCRRSRTPSLKRLSQQAEKRVRSHEIVGVRDDTGLVRNEVMQGDDGGFMAIQDE